MTTELDLGNAPTNMLRCDLTPSNVYPTLVLAIRDMRSAHGRNLETGDGAGGPSWIGVVLGMIVLDTLSGEPQGIGVGTRFKGLLTSHDVSEDDATFVYALRNSLLHGYGLPKPSKVENKRTVLTADTDGYAIDSSQADVVIVSVPAFCSRLVERIAFEAKDEWDHGLIDVDYKYLS